jgi:enoyl-CoA hydratase/carnithine racemase
MFELAIECGVARLAITRPAARNAIPVEGWERLADAVAEATRQDAQLLLLGRAGEAFCAGADIKEFAAFRDDARACARFRRTMRTALDALSDISIPTVAAIDGDCYGAGVALAMACDVRIAGPSACFAITPAKLAISYPQEDVHRLVALVGPGQAARLLLSASAIDGAEAARIGLVDRYLADGFEEGLAALASAIRANDRASLATLKTAIRLATSGVRQHEEQDRRFDQLLGGEELARRLDSRKRPG